MDDMERFVASDLFARHLGIEVLEYTQGKARARMEVKPHHLNSAGMLHGGAIFGLADAVFAIASNSHGTLAVAINAGISYFRAINNGTIFAEAEEISLNPKLATYVIKVKDEKGNVIALFEGTVYRKKEKVSDVLGS